MRVWALASGTLLLSALTSCDPPPLVGTGKPCNSLSDCKAGLTCIEGECDEDLTSIAGQVPVFAVDAGTASADAAVAP